MLHRMSQHVKTSTPATTEVNTSKTYRFNVSQSDPSPRLWLLFKWGGEGVRTLTLSTHEQKFLKEMTQIWKDID